MSNQDTDQPHLQCNNQQHTEEDEDAEFNENLSKDFDLLPLFERQYSAYVSIKKYSLKNNEKLRNRWHERVMTGISAGIKAMPNINDYHFHNCRTKFLPSESLANYKSSHFHLTPGPGVDKYGQRPIPDDMILKRIKPEAKPTASKNKTKTSQVERQESTK
ncbi:uncharacterized protein LOC134659861 [Cydia amplana]|uniref:uncharacterized protein LOC134659861 n=1 Tax=Cydia amplana TaxID=1869771 RepID=UPI002FE67E54